MNSVTHQTRVCILCVTFNRIESLKKLLKLYQEQEPYISKILVVNNCSTDGTTEFLKDWQLLSPKNIVISLETNRGGAGGFYAGLHYYSNHLQEFDFIYIADDDAYPAPILFKTFQDECSDYSSDIAAICTSVHAQNGIDLLHRRRISKRFLVCKETSVPLKEYEQESFELDLYSYVGVFLRRTVLEQNIFPEERFFISYDDSDHAIRVSKIGKIICIPKLRVYHDSDMLNPNMNSWKIYYTRRNGLLFWKRNFTLPLVFITYLRFILFITFTWFKSLFTNPQMATELFIIEITALINALQGKMGLHNTYKPGWKSARQRN